MLGSAAQIGAIGAMEGISAAAAWDGVKQAGENALQQKAATDAKQASTENNIVNTLTKEAGETAKASV